jgi:HEAT repeat protein
MHHSMLSHTLRRAGLVALLGLGGLTLVAPAVMAQAPPAKSASYSEVILLLSAHHELPDKALFEEAGADVVKQLHTVVAARDALSAHKYRALEALAAYWPGDDTNALFADLFAAPDHDLMRHQLMAIASQHLPTKQATALIAPSLKDGDAQIRYTAVDALGRINTSRSRELLRAALLVEKNTWVKDHMQSMLVELK